MEGQVKLRDGKKVRARRGAVAGSGGARAAAHAPLSPQWKSRWLLLRKPSPVAGERAARRGGGGRGSLSPPSPADPSEPARHSCCNPASRNRRVPGGRAPRTPPGRGHTEARRGWDVGPAECPSPRGGSCTLRVGAGGRRSEPGRAGARGVGVAGRRPSLARVKRGAASRRPWCCWRPASPGFSRLRCTCGPPGAVGVAGCGSAAPEPEPRRTFSPGLS